MEAPLEKDMTLSEIIEKAKEVINLDNAKNEVDKLKTMFYKQLDGFVESAKKEWVEKENEIADFVYDKTEELNFKAVLAEYKNIRAQKLKELEEARNKAFKLKNDVIEKLNELVESTDDVDKKFPQFKELQQKWRDAGEVAQDKYKELLNKYQVLNEKFYDFVQISNELRDYDFEKNLKAKTALCEAAEKLNKDAQINKAFQQLQLLHKDWKETGPVKRELREDIWNRFKTASESINKKHAEFFQNIKDQENKNLEAKTAICEKIEAISVEGIDSFKKWEEITNQVLELQKEWKTIGFAPKKSNTEIYERFRVACDVIFKAKTAYYKETKAVFNANLEKKVLLCKKAEELKDSTDWKATSDLFVKLQKEWKEIGPLSRKFSDQVWNRFITACDAFYEAKKDATKGLVDEQKENLAKKLDVIAKIENFKGKTVDALKKLIAEFNAIGHVPFKDKEKIYADYKAKIDAQFDRLKVDKAERQLDMFIDEIENAGEKSFAALRAQRDKLARAFDKLKLDISTRENNIGFLSSKSKKPNPIIIEMEKSIQKLKDEQAVLRKKIAILEENMQNAK